MTDEFDSWFKDMFIDEAKAALDSRQNASSGGDDRYNEGVEAGKQAEQDAFWDAYLNNGGNYRHAFGNTAWTDEIYNPKKSLICTVSAEKMFENSKITDTKVPIEFRCSSADVAFSGCVRLKTIPYLGFFGVTSYTAIFGGCTKLENLTVDGEIQHGIGFSSCSELTDTSVQSILDHLADLTGQTAAKLVFHSAIVSKLTTEQYDQIADKNWYLG